MNDVLFLTFGSPLSGTYALVSRASVKEMTGSRKSHNRVRLATVTVRGERDLAIGYRLIGIVSNVLA
jgi:hypothetical protein